MSRFRRLLDRLLAKLLDSSGRDPRAMEQELSRLRTRVRTQRQQLEGTKRKLTALRRRLARMKRPAGSGKALPHRRPFESAASTRLYTFATIVSYPKSGRTWLANLYVHYARHRFNAIDLPQASLKMPERNLAFQEFLAEHAKEHRFPVCAFTHLGFSSLKPFEAGGEPWPDKARTVLREPTVLVVRDPRDVVVSHYHHLRDQNVEVSFRPLSQFIHGPWGIARIVRFMNMWAAAIRDNHPHLFLCSYESLRRDTPQTFTDMMVFLGADVAPESVAWAIAQSDIDRLRQRERSNRAREGLSLDRNVFRFRKGLVGGHAAELSQAEVARLDEFIDDNLDTAFAQYHSPRIAVPQVPSG